MSRSANSWSRVGNPKRRLGSLKAVSVYAQLPYFGFKCLPGNAQLNSGTGWTTNHAFGFLECGFEHFSFVLGKVSNE